MRAAHYEIRPRENVTLQYLSHDGRPAPRRASRRHRTFANGKILAARPGRVTGCCEGGLVGHFRREICASVERYTLVAASKWEYL